MTITSLFAHIYCAIHALHKSAKATGAASESQHHDGGSGRAMPTNANHNLSLTIIDRLTLKFG